MPNGGTPVTTNDMQFSVLEDGSIICRSLESVPATFERMWPRALFDRQLEGYLDAIGGTFDDRALFERVRKAQTPKKGLLENILFWLGSWYTADKDLAKDASCNEAMRDLTASERRMLLEPALVPALPAPVIEIVRSVDLFNVAVNYGTFAMQFGDRTPASVGPRYIVTSTQLFVLYGACDHPYLDVQPNGKPLARMSLEGRKSRGFFDGKHFMTGDHSGNILRTCRTAPVFSESGYRVDSDKYAIQDGHLFTVVKDVSGKPVGRYKSARPSLLDNGFAKYDLAELVPHV